MQMSDEEVTDFKKRLDHIELSVAASVKSCAAIEKVAWRVGIPTVGFYVLQLLVWAVSVSQISNLTDDLAKFEARWDKTSDEGLSVRMRIREDADARQDIAIEALQKAVYSNHVNDLRETTINEQNVSINDDQFMKWYKANRSFNERKDADYSRVNHDRTIYLKPDDY